MGAAKKLDMPSDEKFLSDAIREGRAVKMELSLKAIGTPDMSLQQRVAGIDVNHVRRLERMLHEETSTYPIVVFRDPDTGKFRIADGFHRWKAHLNAKLTSIWAWVISGTYRDALVYSTMCNQLALLDRKPEDIKKAVMALLEDEEWFGKNNNWIAAHCGVASGTVQKYRATFCELRGVKMPAVLVGPSGQVRTTQRIRGRVIPRVQKHRTGEYRINIDGKKISLGKDREVAQLMVEDLVLDKVEKRVKLSMQGIKRWFASRMTNVTSITLNQVAYASLFGFIYGGRVCTPCDFANPGNGIGAIGRALLLKAHAGRPENPIVVCYPDLGPSGILELGRQLGIEFLTPEELVARIKGEDSPPDSPD